MNLFTALLALPMSAVANRLLTLLRNRVDLRLTREEFRCCQISFSQFGEDLAVIRWLEERMTNAPTIYVDAGCFHPIHFSNTLLLHKRGWRGINIDMFPEKIAAFEKNRPEDYNIVAALSSSRRDMEILEYGGSGTIDRISTQNLTHPHTSPPLRRRKATTRTLNEIISETRWGGQRIGYLNIDCEGHDLEVLKGIDLRVYQPSIITIEAFEQPDVDKIVDFLAAAGYVHRDRLRWTSLFVRRADL